MASYFFDKWFLFYFYRKPSTFDESLTEEFYFWSCLTVPIHLIGGIFILQNPAIINTSTETEGLVKGGFSIEMLAQEHMIVFIIYNIGLMIYLISAPIQRCCT